MLGQCGGSGEDRNGDWSVSGRRGAEGAGQDTHGRAGPAVPPQAAAAP